MPSNDEVVLGMPQIQCPTCRNVLECVTQIHKYTKEQRRKMYGDEDGTMNFSLREYPKPHIEDQPSMCEETTHLVVHCQNGRCPQYNKVKMLKVPRLYAPSVKLEL